MWCVRACVRAACRKCHGPCKCARARIIMGVHAYTYVSLSACLPLAVHSCDGACVTGTAAAVPVLM